MLQRLITLLRHRWLDESDTRRIVGPATLERLTRLVGSSEAQHGGEIRIFVEASLPLSYLWVGSSRVDLQACKLEYSIVSPK